MPLDGEDRGEGASKIGRVGKSLLFFADLVTVKETKPQECEQKNKTGCFPQGFGGPACRDIDTCSESSK